MNSTSFMLSLSKSNFLNYLGTISSPIENSFFLIFIFYCSLIKSWNCDLTWTVEVPPSLLPTWKGRIKNTHYYTTWRECVGGGGGGLGLGLGHRVWLCMFMFINPLSLMSSCMSKSWTCFRMYRKVRGRKSFCCDLLCLLLSESSSFLLVSHPWWSLLVFCIDVYWLLD